MRSKSHLRLFQQEMLPPVMPRGRVQLAPSCSRGMAPSVCAKKMAMSCDKDAKVTTPRCAQRFGRDAGTAWSTQTCCPPEENGEGKPEDGELGTAQGLLTRPLHTVAPQAQGAPSCPSPLGQTPTHTARPHWRPNCYGILQSCCKEPSTGQTLQTSRASFFVSSHRWAPGITIPDTDPTAPAAAKQHE